MYAMEKKIKLTASSKTRLGVHTVFSIWWWW